MKIKLILPYLVIVLLFFVFISGLIVNINPIFAACIGDWGCEHNIETSGTKIIDNEVKCISGSCQETGVTTVTKDCSDLNYNSCGGVDGDIKTELIYTPTFTSDGVCCKHSDTDNVSDCGARTNTHCGADPNLIYEEEWTCNGGSCVIKSDNSIQNCAEDNNKYCNVDGVTVMEETYSCDESSGSAFCDPESKEDKDCSNDDGTYCDGGDILEERSYTCQNDGDDAYCVVSIDKSTSCTTTYGDRSFCQPISNNSVCESYPEATNLTWNENDHNYDFSLHGTDSYPYCGESEPPAVNLSWDYSSQTGDSQSETAVQVSTVSDFSTTIWENNSLGVTESVTIPITLDFDQLYYWRVRVRDDNINWSNDGGYSWSKSTFTTDKKRCDVDFTYTPPQPFVDERVDFVNETTPGDVSINSWDWTFQNGDPADSTEENPSTEFATEGNNDVTLQATDSDNVICSQTQTIGTRVKLPTWQEVDPFN